MMSPSGDIYHSTIRILQSRPESSMTGLYSARMCGCSPHSLNIKVLLTVARGQREELRHLAL